MKKTSFWFFLLGAAVLSGCDPYVHAEYPGGYNPHGVYVSQGGCWADGVWYAPCRWPVGTDIGYYRRDRDVWILQPRPVWGYPYGVPPYPYAPHYPGPIMRERIPAHPHVMPPPIILPPPHRTMPPPFHHPHRGPADRQRAPRRF